MEIKCEFRYLNVSKGRADIIYSFVATARQGRAPANRHAPQQIRTCPYGNRQMSGFPMTAEVLNIAFKQWNHGPLSIYLFLGMAGWVMVKFIAV